MCTAEPCKTCHACGASWADLPSLVADPQVELAAYHPVFEQPEQGLILFVHHGRSCLSTIALPVGALRPLHAGPVPERLGINDPDCPRLCLSSTNFDPCAVPCRMAWVRNLFEHLQRHELPGESGGRGTG